MKITAQRTLAEKLGVSYIRVQDIRIDYDNSNVYISATVLDRAPAAGKPTECSSEKYVISNLTFFLKKSIFVI